MRVRTPALGLVVSAMTLSAAPALASVPATTLQSTTLGAAGFGSIAVDDTGHHVFVSQPQGNDIEEYDFQGNLVATVPNIYGAYGMTINAGELYIAESSTGRVVQLPLGNIGLAPTIVASGLVDPTWLVYSGGKLWAAEQSSNSWGNVASVDPGSGKVATLGSFYEPDLAVSPGDPSTLFVAEDGISPGSVYRYDVSGTTPALVASNTFTDQENIEGLAISPDGTRLIPASGYPYKFEELSASTLNADGLIYPGAAYPAAVAVSSSGMLATGLSGYDATDLSVYPLGKPAASFTASAVPGSVDGGIVSHGLALNADATRMFAVSAPVGSSTNDSFAALALYPPTATISAPAAAQTYALNQNVVTAYSCADTQGPGITSCVDSGGGSGGSGRLDTTALGPHSYTVTATSGDGATGVGQISYTVAAAPTVSITTPSANATYQQGQTVNAAYSCQDGAYGPGLTAAGCTGTTANGSPISTSTAGSHSFTATATSADGQTVTQTVSYTVSAPTADLSVAISGATQANANSSFSETLTVKNLGPATATSVSAALTIPSNVSVSGAAGGVVSGSQVKWSAPSLAAGASANYTVSFRAGPKVSGTAAITGSATAATADPNAANNSATQSVTFGKPK